MEQSRQLSIRWDRIAALTSLLLLVGGLAGGIYILHHPPVPGPPVPVLKQLDREVMRGAKVFYPQRSELPAVQFDSVRIAKPRFGGISLGGFNRLEIDGLQLVADVDSDPKNGAPGSGDGFFNVRKLLNVEELCRQAGISQRVSSVRVNSFSLSVFANGELTKILYAKSAKSVQSGRFSIEQCGFLDEALAWHQVAKAELDVKRGVLITGSNPVHLRDVIKAVSVSR